MHWYLVHSKPRQERLALENLERQGYQCYLPLLPTEKIRRGSLTVTDEALFPRYLFIRLGNDLSAKGWGPIRYTTGVSRLVSFGSEPARIDDCLIAQLQSSESRHKERPARLFEAGDRIRITDGPFAGIEGVFQIAEGDKRVMVLIEMMSKPVSVRVTPSIVRKLG
jgi:transcriptional antiterminator RfaH